MYCIFILFVSIIICEVNSESIEQKVKNYFQGDDNRNLRKQWDSHRKSLENAILLAMKETIGFGGMNVYIRKSKEALAKGYYHNDNQVRLILQDLHLEDLPRCWMPDVQFSLASNLLKIQTDLSKMLIHAEYSVVRNKSDIIYEAKNQDPLESSPFLFQQVQDAGEVTISVENCMLSGFMVTTLNGESINLGYHNFELVNCQYTFEIYMPGEGSPPVIAKYAPYRDIGGLYITDLLMKPIEEELVPKLQAAMFSYVNTSSVFNKDLQYFRKNQEDLFYATSQYLTEVVRRLNKLEIELNGGEFWMEKIQIYWYDGRSKQNGSKKGEVLKLTDVVLTGLDTLYSAHIGGPYKQSSLMIGEEIRFSSLQVRGHLLLQSLEHNPKGMDKYGFAAEINDAAVSLHLNVSSEPAQVQRVEVTRFRSTSLTVSGVIFESAKALIHGYLQSEVPRELKAHINRYISYALKPQNGKALLVKEPIKSESGEWRPDREPRFIQNDGGDEFAGADSTHEMEPKQLGSNERIINIPKKAKKRFKSANRPRRHNIARKKLKSVKKFKRSKRLANNRILKE